MKSYTQNVLVYLLVKPGMSTEMNSSPLKFSDHVHSSGFL